MKSTHSKNFILLEVIVGLLGCVGANVNITTPVFAQVIADPSLGTTVNQNDSTYQITGGTNVGGRNLFHSFSRFDVPDKGVANFLNESGTVNIFSRVTGKTPSDIQGLIRAQGSANLFLMNPNGIVFGRNARLDVGGSFIATTAEAINFANGQQFKAISSQAPSLLTISVPLGLQFGANPGKIQVQGSGHNLSYSETGSTIRSQVPGLQVQPQKTLALVGGDVILEGGNLRAESGRIELGSVALPGLVSLAQNDSGFALGYSDVQNFGKILLSKTALADVSGESGGKIQVQSGQLSLRDGSAILSITQGSKSGKSFTINAKDSVELIGESSDNRYASSFSTEAQGNGSTGDMKINTRKLIITDGAYIQNYSFSGGNGGNLTIQASDSVDIIGRGLFKSGLYTGASNTGNAGNLTITTGNLIVRDGARITSDTSAQGNAGNLLIQTERFSVFNSQISASTFGKGDAANLTVHASESVELSGEDPTGFPGGLFAQIDIEGQRNGSKLIIETKRLSVSDGSKIQVSTFGEGNSGDLFIRASDIDIFETSINNFFSTGIFSEVSLAKTPNSPEILARGKGNAGNLTIETERLRIRDGGQVSVSTYNLGNAGTLTVKASDSIEVLGIEDNSTFRNFRNVSFLGAEVKEGATGRGGNLKIQTGRLSVKDGAQVSVNTFGAGNAGNLFLQARDFVEVVGTSSDNQFKSQLSAAVGQNSTGRGGRIAIETRDISIRDGGIITSSSEGQKSAGNITVNVNRTLQANNGDISTTSTQSSGGAIDITARNIHLQNDSDITTNVFTGRGGGGNINLTADSIIALNDNDILAFARDGKGGDITLNTPAFFGYRYQPVPVGTDLTTLDGNDRVDINASGAVSGVITLPERSFLQNSLTELPQNTIDTNTLIANSCIARSSRQEGTFTITGSGGLPYHPGDAFISPYPTGDIQRVKPNTSTPWKKGDPIIEPTGVYRFENGSLVMSRECI
ncbi:MAG: S-layer family protein [Fischerella sp. CENA71]|nr:S-layer family protein [Fischerella sp. CENA71]